MIDSKSIKEALCGAILLSPNGDGMRVTTHCLYPSNSTVSVTVRGGRNEFIVMDDGEAVSEAMASGLIERASDKQIRNIIKSYGLNAKNGVIFTPIVGLSELPAAILLVANAAKDVANWSMAHLRYRERRNFKTELSILLERHFHNNIKSAPVTGLSNRQYKFDHIIYYNQDKCLIVDPVVNDPSSINARLVANLDIKMLGNSNINQIIIYDDQSSWSSSDLNVLEMGAKILPFSRAEPHLLKLVA